MMRNFASIASRKFGRFNSSLGTLSGYILFVMNGIVFYEVMMRYFFRMPPRWTNETASFMLLFISFIPAGFVLQRNEHIQVDFFVMRVGKRIRKWLNVFHAFFGAGYFALLFWQTCRLVIMAFKREWVTVEMMIPMGYPLLLLPIGCFILFVSFIFKGFDELSSQ